MGYVGAGGAGAGADAGGVTIPVVCVAAPFALADAPSMVAAAAAAGGAAAGGAAASGGGGVSMDGAMLPPLIGARVCLGMWGQTIMLFIAFADGRPSQWVHLMDAKLGVDKDWLPLVDPQFFGNAQLSGTCGLKHAGTAQEQLSDKIKLLCAMHSPGYSHTALVKAQHWAHLDASARAHLEASATSGRLFRITDALAYKRISNCTNTSMGLLRAEPEDHLTFAHLWLLDM